MTDWTSTSNSPNITNCYSTTTTGKSAHKIKTHQTRPDHIQRFQVKSTTTKDPLTISESTINEMKHLILVGACYLDTILTYVAPTTTPSRINNQQASSVPQFPSEDSKLRATNLSIRRGGNCPNSLEVLQQLLKDRDEVQTHLVSCLPRKSSDATRRIISSFGQGSKIDFSHCIYRDENTEAASSYIIRSKESGSRTIVNYNGLREMDVDEFERVVREFSSDQETWWHFEVSSHQAIIYHTRQVTPCIGSHPRHTAEMLPFATQTSATGADQCRGRKAWP